MPIIHCIGNVIILTAADTDYNNTDIRNIWTNILVTIFTDYTTNSYHRCNPTVTQYPKQLGTYWSQIWTCATPRHIPACRSGFILLQGGKEFWVWATVAHFKCVPITIFAKMWSFGKHNDYKSLHPDLFSHLEFLTCIFCSWIKLKLKFIITMRMGQT